MLDRTLDAGYPLSPAFERLVASTLAARICARSAVDDSSAEVDWNMSPARYYAEEACKNAEAEAEIVHAWNTQCVNSAVAKGDDPGLLRSKHHLSQVAWIHYHHARNAAVGAKNDPVFGPRAAQAVARALRAARAISRASSRAVTQALRARAAARARTGAPARLRCARQPVRRAPRRRAPARRVRLSAVASAGSGSGDPSPEPSGSTDPADGVRLPAGRRA